MVCERRARSLQEGRFHGSSARSFSPRLDLPFSTSTSWCRPWSTSDPWWRRTSAWLGPEHRTKEVKKGVTPRPSVIKRMTTLRVRIRDRPLMPEGVRGSEVPTAQGHHYLDQPPDQALRIDVGHYPPWHSHCSSSACVGSSPSSHPAEEAIPKRTSGSLVPRHQVRILERQLPTTVVPISHIVAGANKIRELGLMSPLH
jgi:hypothetical protein